MVRPFAEQRMRPTVNLRRLFTTTGESRVAARVRARYHTYAAHIYASAHTNGGGCPRAVRVCVCVRTGRPPNLVYIYLVFSFICSLSPSEATGSPDLQSRVILRRVMFVIVVRGDCLFPPRHVPRVLSKVVWLLRNVVLTGGQNRRKFFRPKRH